MNLLNLLTKEKRVAGIEISDSVVRIAFLRPIVHSAWASTRINAMRTIVKISDSVVRIAFLRPIVHSAWASKRIKAMRTISAPKTKPTVSHELVLIEEPIAANIIVQGVVVDKVLLGKTLKNIWINAKLGTDYAIVAIPDDKIYSRIFSFPKTTGGARLTEAMNLAIGFQLPMKTEDVYLDWERTRGATYSNEILLSTIPRTVANEYVEALDVAGIKTLAVESHLASIARAIKLEPGHTAIFTKKTPDGATVFVLKNSLLRFSRTFPSQFISEDDISADVDKIKSSLEAVMTDKRESVAVLDLLLASVRDDYANYPRLSNSKETKSKWLVALGAAIRGQIPEGDDNLISLLPVGTEEAYTYQKATTFVTLIRDMTVGVSIFFFLAFISTYLFMLSLSQGSSRTIATLSAVAVWPELLAKEAWIAHVNALTGTAAGILSETPLWSTVIDEVNARIIDGIVISNFSAPSITAQMSLTGIAKDRATLNQFKKSFQGSAMFSEINLPTTNIAQKGGVPFTVSFILKDQGAVYYGQSESQKIESESVKSESP